MNRSSRRGRRYFIQAEKQLWHFAEDSEAGLYIGKSICIYTPLLKEDPLSAVRDDVFSPSGADKCTGLNYTDGSELYMQIGAGSTYVPSALCSIYLEPRLRQSNNPKSRHH